VVAGAASEDVRNVLVDAYRRLGFDTLADEAFRALVLARIVKPTSTSAAVGSSTSTVWWRRSALTAASARCVGKDYRITLDTA
jgi:hypothetical protein